MSKATAATALTFRTLNLFGAPAAAAAAAAHSRRRVVAASGCRSATSAVTPSSSLSSVRSYQRWAITPAGSERRATPRRLNRSNVSAARWFSSGPANAETEPTTRPQGSGPETPKKARAPLKTVIRDLAIFVTFAGGLIYGLNSYKTKKKREKMFKDFVEGNNITGKGDVGGPFKLVNHEGEVVTNEDFLGRYMLIYFGFTHCPDICPEELEKMGEVVNFLKAEPMIGNVATPIFITCDPARDGVAEVKKYIKQFHPDFVGLTGQFEELQRLAKDYRLYFSAPPSVQPGDDYLVDHSIYFYLMDPHGQFLDAYGRDWNAKEVSLSVMNRIMKYRNQGGMEGKKAVLKQREEWAKADKLKEETETAEKKEEGSV